MLNPADNKTQCIDQIFSNFVNHYTLYRLTGAYLHMKSCQTKAVFLHVSCMQFFLMVHNTCAPKNRPIIYRNNNKHVNAATYKACLRLYIH